mmetsp:Transcript_92471/g.249546  ORF Transcript_92471/g.249546 Transcript_92471/m.249546 type:complete len:103 (-) Transcript_92471:48-356(-)
MAGNRAISCSRSQAPLRQPWFHQHGRAVEVRHLKVGCSSRCRYHRSSSSSSSNDFKRACWQVWQTWVCDDAAWQQGVDSWQQLAHERGTLCTRLRLPRKPCT